MTTDRDAALNSRDDTMNNTFSEIIAERARQDQQWGGPEHDDEHSPQDWIDFIGKQWHHAAMGEGDLRERLIKIAALAVAAIESHDRTMRDYGTHDDA